MNIYFETLDKNDYDNFKKDVQEAFALAVMQEFKDTFSNACEVIPDEDINQSLYNPKCSSYYIYANGLKVGGVVLNIDNNTHHNDVEILFIYPKYHSKGIGQKVWKAIEEKYPETEVWELVTPYFEKRNINFYVNKCGFHIVEYFNKYHLDDTMPYDNINQREFEEDFFRFQKVMKKSNK